MTNHSSIPPDEERVELEDDVPLDGLASLLDEYVDAMARGDDLAATRLLALHRELEPFVACLDQLESLAGHVFPEQPEIEHEPSESSQDDPGRSHHAPFANSFDKYELTKELGRGGMGVVYQARQIDLDRTVAVKMILASHFASDEEIRRFYAEARAAGRLNHANIVGIHEVGEIHGQPFFAMDHVEGQSLACVLKTVVMDSETITRLLAQVARAVAYLHENGIVHRDLKPSNILLDRSGTPFVTDFGLAKVFSDEGSQTRTGAIMGTPSYMPPEQAAGRTSQVGERSDIYSLGAILYEMLTGRPPFLEETALDTLVQVLDGEPALPSKLNPNVPRELERICLHCLEKVPEKRYATANELADDLERFLRREPIHARTGGFIARVHRWIRREPVLVSHLAGLLTAVVIVQFRYSLYSAIVREKWWDYHLTIMGILGIWMTVSFVFQWLLNRGDSAGIARLAWTAADAILMTTTFCLISGPPGPLLIGYPLLVACAGLFFEVRLVLFTTVVSMISYAGFIFIRPDETIPPHYAIIYAAVLAVIGCVVAYQVYRVRVLSRYFERRR